MATYPLAPVLLSTVNDTDPLGIEDAAMLDDALRQTRYLFKQLMLVAHNDDGTLKPGSALSDGSVSETKIADGAVTADKLKQIPGSEAVITTAIRDLAVTGAKIAAGTITAAKLGALAVETAAINNLAVTEGKLAAGAVTNGKIGALAVATGQIQDSAVTDAKVASGLAVAKLASAGTARLLVDDTTVQSLQVDTGGDVSMAVVAGKAKFSFTNVIRYFADAVLLSETGNVGGSVIDNKWVPRPWRYQAATHSAPDSSLAIYPSPNAWLELVDHAGQTVEGQVVTVTSIKFKIAGTYYVRGTALAVDTDGANTPVLGHCIGMTKVGSWPYGGLVHVLTGTLPRSLKDIQVPSTMEGYITVAQNDEFVIRHWAKALSGSANKDYLGIGSSALSGAESLCSVFITKVS